MTNEVISEKKKFDLIGYLRNVRVEMGKIHWPNRKEATISTVMVFVMVIVMSVFLFVTDQVVATLIKFILGLNG